MKNYIEEIFEEINLNLSELSNKVIYLYRILNEQDATLNKKINVICLNKLNDINHILHVGNNLISVIYQEIGFLPNQNQDINQTNKQ